MAGCRRQLGRDRIPDLSVGKPVLTGVQCRAERAQVNPVAKLRHTGSLDKRKLADWRAGRNAVYQLTVLTISAPRGRLSLNLDRNPRLMQDVIMREVGK